MTHGAVTVGGGTDVRALAALMVHQRLEVVLVAEAAGEVVGLVAARALLACGSDGLVARDVMDPAPPVLSEDVSVATAAALMTSLGLAGMPVACSRCGRTCVVTADDVLRWVACQGGSPPTYAGDAMGG